MSAKRRKEFKMTKKEFFNAIATKSVITDEMVEIATKEYKALEAKSAKTAEAKALKRKEDEPIERAICEYLSTHASALASELATASGVSTSKVCAICNRLIANNAITVARVKIPKVGERNVYKIAE